MDIFNNYSLLLWSLPQFDILNAWNQNKKYNTKINKQNRNIKETLTDKICHYSSFPSPTLGLSFGSQPISSLMQISLVISVAWPNDHRSTFNSWDKNKIFSISKNN